MHPFLKWPLAALTLIGSILGAGLTLLTIPLALGPGADSSTTLPFFVASAFYALGIVAGLRFANNDSRRGLMRLYYALQIPWLSSPLIGLRFVSGANVSAALPSFSYSLGSVWHFGSSHAAPWGLGLNLLALAILFLLRGRPQNGSKTARRKGRRKK